MTKKAKNEHVPPIEVVEVDGEIRSYRGGLTFLPGDKAKALVPEFVADIGVQWCLDWWMRKVRIRIEDMAVYAGLEGIAEREYEQVVTPEEDRLVRRFLVRHNVQPRPINVLELMRMLLLETMPYVAV